MESNMVDPLSNLSTSSRLSVKAADAALNILNEKISQMKEPLVFGNESRLYNNQFIKLVKLELAEMEQIASSMAEITSTKKKILEAELICHTSMSLMEKVITDAFSAFDEFEKRINEMHGKLQSSDYAFLDDAAASEPNMKDNEGILAEPISEIATVSGLVNTKADEKPIYSTMDDSMAAMGISNPSFKYDFQRTPFTARIGKEISERKEIEKRLHQPLSARKPLSERRWDSVPSHSSIVKPTPICSKSGRMPVIASGGSSLDGSPFFVDQKNENTDLDKFQAIPFRNRLLEHSSIVQPKFDDTDSELFETGAMELAFTEESPSGSDIMKNDNEPESNPPVSVLPTVSRAHSTLRTPLTQRPSDVFARSLRPSLAVKPGDDSRLPRPSLARPSLAFELKRPVYTSTIGKQFNK